MVILTDCILAGYNIMCPVSFGTYVKMFRILKKKLAELHKNKIKKGLIKSPKFIIMECNNVMMGVVLFF